MKETNKYTITLRHGMRIGQTVFLVTANRENRCPKCGVSSFWKYYIKKAKITAMGFFVGINGKQEVYYYYQDGKEKWSHLNDTIVYLTQKDAQDACDIENTKETKK
ncbi:unnamed protein product [marine sediment metagenome]|uniref:Uncharacterized protein n=1 Tax=marine sediment metagenome TaxID=412755 RepID=X0XQL9_9ZZZZ